MILFYLLVSILPFDNPPLLSRFLGDSALKTVGALCLVYAASRGVLLGSAPNLFGTWQGRLFVIFYLLAGVSYFVTLIGINAFVVYTGIFVLYVVTVWLVKTPRVLLFTLSAAVLGITFGALHLIREYAVNRAAFGSRADYRAGMSVGEANYFATSAALCMPFAILMLARSQKILIRLLFGLCAGVSIIGITLSASRGGFLALAAAMLVLILRSQRRILNLAIVTVLIIPILFLAPISPLQRLLHPNQTDRDSSEARLIAWRAGLRMIETNPMFGVGIDRFRELMPKYYESEERSGLSTMAHNTYVEVAAELGIPCLGIFVGILFFSYKTLNRVRRRAEKRELRNLYFVALGLEGGLAGYVVGAMFLSAEYLRLFWLIVFCTIAAEAVCERWLHASKRAPAVTEVAHEFAHHAAAGARSETNE